MWDADKIITQKIKIIKWYAKKSKMYKKYYEFCAYYTKIYKNKQYLLFDIDINRISGMLKTTRRLCDIKLKG